MGSSPYQSVGIYIGGSSRGCSQPNLTASWVQTQYNAGWRFQPIYVGEQASAISSATSEATAAADDAVTQASSLGFGTGSTLYYDMEAYSSSYSSNVLAFESAWTKELHAKGYHSAIYSSSSSGITDLVNNYTSSSYTMPDAIYDALWNGSANTSDPAVPSGDWSGHQRVHQYGSLSETWGGVNQSIDQDYLDIQLPETSTAAAFAGGTGNPAQVLHSDGRLESMLVQSNGGIMSAQETSAGSGSFGALSTVGNATAGVQVTLAVNGNGQSQLFDVQGNGGIMTRLETSAGSHSWGAWTTLDSAGAASQVVVGRHSDGRLEAIALTPTGGINRYLETAQGSNSWSAAGSFGASNIKHLTLGTEQDGRLHLFALQSNGAIADITESAPGTGVWGSWSNFAPAGSVSVTTTPADNGSFMAVGNFASGAMVFAIVKADGSVATRYQTAPNSSWSATWGSQSATGAAKSIAVTSHADGKLDLVAVQTDGGLVRLLESSANGGWNTTWDHILPANDVAAVTPVIDTNGKNDLLVVQTNGGIATSQETGNDGFVGSWTIVAPAGAVSTN